MIRYDLTYEQALEIPDPKTIWLDGGRVVVDDSPSVEIPLSVEGWQARLALMDAGLLTAVNDYIDANNGEVKIRWNWSSAVLRNSPHVLAVAAALELTSEDLDNLFVAAANKS